MQQQNPHQQYSYQLNDNIFKIPPKAKFNIKFKGMGGISGAISDMYLSMKYGGYPGIFELFVLEIEKVCKLVMSVTWIHPPVSYTPYA